MYYLVDILANVGVAKDGSKRLRVVLYADEIEEFGYGNNLKFKKETGIQLECGSIAYDSHKKFAILDSDGNWQYETEDDEM